ncbi:hypothetical protein [Streptosporangium sp. 'caverna']|uniref:hypothetical protein n=1 Tax=Streptosporangium sp. 'caverna' TaxID=2202249 RepID=UPI0013A70B6C|nr:hypothetical protein [Streptosporangium sp. 'caverna']
MSTPNSRMDSAGTRTRPKDGRSYKGLATLTLAGSLSVTLAATLSASAVASPSLDGQASAPVSSRLQPTPTPTPTVTVTARSTSTANLTGNRHRRICRPKIFFRFHYARPRNFFVPRTRFIDGPGGEMNVSVNRQHRVYAEIELEHEFNPEVERNEESTREREVTSDDVVNRANVVRAARRLFRIRDMDSPLLAEEYIVETGHQYTQPITAGMYGNMWYRVFGYRMGFTAWHRVTTCDAYKITAGIANVPARVEGWKYWETTHPMFRGHRLWDK